MWEEEERGNVIRDADGIAAAVIVGLPHFMVRARAG
jgi:hypothetical protein